MESGPASSTAPEPEQLGSTMQAPAGEQRMEFTLKPRPILEPQVGQVYAAWVEKMGSKTADPEGKLDER